MKKQIKFKYDLAFSLLEEDKNEIAPLNDLLKSKLKTFYYPERQKIITGTDGEQTFSKIFQTDSRAVVIIYRPKWGTTKWTGIEQTAIRNRGFEETYDFTLLIPMVKPVTTPKWFPKQYIWFDIDRLGITGAAAIIEQRVRELGGIPKPETIENAAERIRQEVQFQRDRKNYLDSNTALSDAKYEIKRLYSLSNNYVERLEPSDPNLPFSVKEDRYSLKVHVIGFSLCILWHNTASNILHEFNLAVKIDEQNRDRFRDDEPPHCIYNEDYDFDINMSNEIGWRERNGNKRFLTSEQLLDISFKSYLIKIHDYIRNRIL